MNVLSPAPRCTADSSQRFPNWLFPSFPSLSFSLPVPPFDLCIPSDELPVVVYPSTALPTCRSASSARLPAHRSSLSAAPTVEMDPRRRKTGKRSAALVYWIAFLFLRNCINKYRNLRLVSIMLNIKKKIACQFDFAHLDKNWINKKLFSSGKWEGCPRRGRQTQQRQRDDRTETRWRWLDSLIARH